MYNGIINVYKEKGYTSHDVVARLRGILKQKKIGHTGTLDPDATGVLPVCLGCGTKLCDMLTDRSKEYEAVLLLGVTTDTEDISGKILSKKPVEFDNQTIADAVMSFQGAYEQIPPMYSAIKIGGQKLYELARKGEVVERKPRHVEIPAINIISINGNEVRMTIQCSKGTYIRSICRDIGDKLGCGGCMKELTRTRVGNFLLKDAMTIDMIEKKALDNSIEDSIIAVDSIFSDYPRITVADRNAMLVNNGNMFKISGSCYEGKVRVYIADESNENDEFAGIYNFDKNNGFYRPVKMFRNGE